MSTTYTIKYSNLNGNKSIAILDGEKELVSFTSKDSQFQGLLKAIPAFSSGKNGEMVQGTVEQLAAKFNIDLDVEGEPDGDSDDNMPDSKKIASGQTEVLVDSDPQAELQEENSPEEEEEEVEEDESEESTESEEGEDEETEESEESEESEEEEEETEESEEEEGLSEEDSSGENTPDLSHLDTDAGHLSEIERRVAEIEATLAGLSGVFTGIEKEAESIDSIVDTMQDDDAAERDKTGGKVTNFALPELEINIPNGALTDLDFTDGEVELDSGSGDEASEFYAGSRAWSDPSGVTDPGEAIEIVLPGRHQDSDDSEENEENEEEEESEGNEYEMYDDDDDEEWIRPHRNKPGLRKFKL